jgi:exodeoxyribonuclease VII large subunit
LHKNNPEYRIDKLKFKLVENTNNLIKLLNNHYRNQRFRFAALFEKLFLLNPLSILNRGYSITRSIPDGSIVKDAGLVPIHQKLQITLAQGVLICRVEGKQDHDSKNIRSSSIPA